MANRAAGPLRQGAPIFSQPVRPILAMVSALALVAFGVWIALPQVAPVFLANPLLNGFIALVFLIGVATCFWQQIQTVQSVRWIEGFARSDPEHRLSAAPRLLAPLASLLRSRGRRMQITATASRSILDSVATRIDEARDITRYIVNLLIFLGLLGTFYGLATTVPAIVETIRGLAPTDGTDGASMFGNLISGLEAQLGGMGVAFSSSLLGLAGSLVVGLLELLASNSQNRFYRELEEWLSTITRLGFAAAEGDGEGAPAAAIGYLAEQLDRLETILERSEASQEAAGRSLKRLAEAVERLSDGAEGAADLGHVMARVADSQARLAEAFEAAGDAGGLDAESRMRLRSMDVQLLRIHEELTAGRTEATAELRSELRHLGRTLTRGPDAPRNVRAGE